MPIITKKDINNQYFIQYVITGIMPNGEIIAIKKDKNENFHREAFKRFTKEIEKTYKITYQIKKEKECEEFLDLFSSKGIITISTYYIYQLPYKLSSDIQLIRFPQKFKDKQYKAFVDFINKGVFDQIGLVEYNKYGDKECAQGLDNLIQYVKDNARDFYEI